MKRILVTGASGLLGLNFCYFFHKKYQVKGVANNTRLFAAPFELIHENLLEIDPGKMLDDVQPGVVLHCAAMANIDQCEKHPADAYEINSVFPGKLAKASYARNIKFVHISTDAVFDGEDCGHDGYREDDPANPICKYAKTKLIGEQEVLENNSNALVARVNFYGWSTSGTRSLVEFFLQ